MAVINKVEQSNIYSSIESNVKKSNNNKIDKIERKSNFIMSTISELRKVDWPTPIHVLKWSFVTIIFCGMLGILLGYSDKFFSSSISYSNCLISVNRNETSDSRADCSRNYFNAIILR